MQEKNSNLDPTQHLPLSLCGSEILPPAPTPSAIDFLWDFAGYSWLAYGASSLLVISHFPSGLSKQESLIGPILRQVFELSGDDSSAVSAVSWSPVAPSLGEVGAACENCIFLFSHDSASSTGAWNFQSFPARCFATKKTRHEVFWRVQSCYDKLVFGSFCWSQNAVLVQNTKVEAIKWTGSGDGILSGGTEVVLWRYRSRSWEIAWKVIMDQPQTLLSATWSIGGPSASASYPGSFSSDECSKCVSVYYSDGNLEYAKSELCHPQPVTMVQWRQSDRKQLDSDGKHFRNVLLTCCLDGTARLWCEVYNGRGRKVDRDGNDHKKFRQTFSVAAVIEINQALNGTLGSNVFLTWAAEVRGIFKMSDGGNKIFSSKKHDHDYVGACEWLVGFGPGSWVGFWSVHCLDDIFPMRFPRVMLWKRQELKLGHFQGTASSNFKEHPLLNKVLFTRNFLSGPPAVCSLIHYLPCGSVVCSMLQTQQSSNIDESFMDQSKVEKSVSCYASGALNIYGHTGKVLQVSVHPHSYEVELAASLDSDGLLLFWSLSTIKSSSFVTKLLSPSWVLCGKLDSQNYSLKYTSISWAPSVLNEDRIIFLGHAEGIDCFVVKLPQSNEGNINSHYLCTISVTGLGPYEHGPISIFTIPLASTCKETFKYNKFLLLAIWIKGFHALSWEITLHSSDSPGSCKECNFGNVAAAECSMYSFDSVFGGHNYCLDVDPCSARLPDPYASDDVTSFAVVCPASLTFVQQKWEFSVDSDYNYPPYVMATGCSDGTLKIWRSKMAKLKIPYMPWELVGILAAHAGPIVAISLTDCGQKIATVGKERDSLCRLKIWDPLPLMGGGSYTLEGTINLPRDFVTLKWLTIGNGQRLLGVCMQNELQIYARRRCESSVFLSPQKSLVLHSWSCVAFAHTFPLIYDFIWGPRATGVVIHHSYFSLFNQSLFLVDKNNISKSKPHYTQDNSSSFTKEMCKNVDAAVFTDDHIGLSKVALLDDGNRGSCRSNNLEEISAKENCTHNSFAVAMACLKDAYIPKLGAWSMLEVVEKLGGSVPIYHPQALLLNICSGNWQRAIVSVRHLIECLTTKDSPEKKNGFEKTSYGIPQIPLSKYLGPVMELSTDKGFQWSVGENLYSATSSDMPIPSSTQSEFGDFVELLEKHYELAAIDVTEKFQILAIIDLLSEVSNPHRVCAYASLDEPGRRFWVALRFQQQHLFWKFGRKPALEELVVESRLTGWAFLSDCQEILLDSLLPGGTSWKEMQSLGVGYWFTNATELRTRMEKIARLQYLKKKDPKDCALLYIALNRVQVLAGLFKISKDERDKPLVGFLSRNFQEEKNKAAALKNAYVLLGRHQLELAIAFFMLGGDPTSAVTVCAKNLGDEQLALVICRLVEGQGGELQRHLITKVLLQSAIEKGDYWLASLLEWQLGNCCQSFLTMIGFNETSMVNKSAVSINHIAFVDPNIGLYCLTLATTNRMRNAIGEQNAALLLSWSTYMTATSLSRCGLPFEALEYFSSSLSGSRLIDKGHGSDDVYSEVLPRILKSSSGRSSNYLLSDVAMLLESYAKSDLVLHYVSKLIKEHPNWSDTVTGTLEGATNFEGNEIHPYNTLLENFRNKLYTGLAQCEQKFSVDPSYLINMAFLYSCNTGLKFVGFDILHGFASQNYSQGKIHLVDNYLFLPFACKLVLETVKELSYLSSRFIVACNITCTDQLIARATSSKWSHLWSYYFQDFLPLCWNLRAALKVISCSLPGDHISQLLGVLVLFEQYVCFSSAWLHKYSKGILLKVQPLLNTSTEGHISYEVNMTNLKKILHQNEELAHDLLKDDAEESINESACVQNRQGGDIVHLIPKEDRWRIIGACLWQHMFKFLKHKSDNGYISSASCSEVGYRQSCSGKFDSMSVEENMKLFPMILMDFLKTTVIHLSSYHIKHLALFLGQQADNRLHIPTLLWLEETCHSQPRELCQHEGSVTMQKVDTSDESSTFERIWNISADASVLAEGFATAGIDWSHYFKHKSCQEWIDFDKEFIEEHIPEDLSSYKGRNSGNTAENGSTAREKSLNSHTFWQKNATSTEELSPFQKPKEVCKRNGELLEALCTNSVNQHQAALASNRKGIVFFNWENGMASSELAAEFIWADAEWPHNGWAGSQSTPIPTCVSPGVGLGSKKGAHLGLGGATIGTTSLTKPARGFSGGRARGNAGHSGVGASSLGWGIQEDFEELTDPPATVENIATRAFSSHPARPLFLVGSINTHIYLWEFGKDRATATYGVLPAANVPPPYALASISALQFDHCGHRFASAALDGTICTWQLEVGGRSNICPTESSLCFNSHASDVTYVTSSGSIVAAAGCGSNGVNVVIWDTLAPSTTSRASIICHGGGARSISVFDNDLGSGSVSPIIVTGGKDGDIGLHDFRYIATGKTKRHRKTSDNEPKNNASSIADARTGLNNKLGDQDVNGMLWYIPKAHSGSVTKISTIPNTSLFLTGGKDGDVKLWDAKRARLVYHWPKLHDRHTFLQPSTRGYSGITRAAVTDIQVVSNGFLTCGGDGSVKLIQLKDSKHGCEV